MLHSVYSIGSLFDVKIYAMSKQKQGMIVETDKRTQLIKKMDVSKDKIELVHQWKEFLVEHGMKYIDQYRLSTDGLPYALYNGEYYVMCSLNFTDPFDYHHFDDVLLLTKTVAFMHLITKKFSWKMNEKIKREISGKNLKTYYEKRISELKYIKKWIGKQAKLSEIDVFFIKHYGNLSENAQRAFHLLERSQYENKISENNSSYHLCHNKLKEINIKRRDDLCFIGGFESCIVDYHIKDVSEIIRRYGKNKNFDEKKYHILLNEYDKINPLTKDDVEVLHAILLFPEKYIRLCNEYYNKRKTCINANTLRRLEKSLQDFHTASLF